VDRTARAAGPVHQGEPVAGLHELGLPGAEAEAVDLAVCRDQGTVAVEHQRGVPQVLALRAALAVGRTLHDRAGVQHDPRLARRGGHRLRHGPVDGLGPLLPRRVVEAPGGPELGQDDEVVAGLGAHHRSHPLGALLDALLVAVGQLDHGNAHVSLPASGLGRVRR
jgi:hypothetical protein